MSTQNFREAIKDYDSAFCGNVPLSNINLIQPHGYLLVLDKNSLAIQQLSENCNELFDAPLNEIVEQELQGFIQEDISEILSHQTDGSDREVPVYLNWKGMDRPFLGLIQTHADYFILELQKNSSANTSFTEVYQNIRYILSKFEEAKSVQELAEVVVREMQDISGFERVMFYQFDPQWNGKVIAEQNATGKQDYLGHQFPASDIPRQAREMYQRMSFRLIPTIHYTPVKLYPVINPVTLSFVDLSNSSLRSVAPVHLEFLENMGVDASMSFRIVVNNVLWGLISFHHNTALYPDFQACASLELLSEYVSRVLSNLLNKKSFEFISSLTSKSAEIQQQLYTISDIREALLGGKVNLMELFRADGAFVTIGKKSYSAGLTLPDEEIQNLIFWLQSKDSKVFATDYLSGQFEEALDYTAVASGILAIELDRERGNFIVLFRKERPYTISWGGNPDDAIRFEPDNKTYHPRNSFQLWKQEVQNTSLPWHEQHIQAAQTLRNHLFEYLSKHL